MSFSSISVGSKKISPDGPVFIIAEAGVNHNGDIVIAKKLIDAAIAAHVDAVKFQTFTAHTLVTMSADQAEYQTKNIGKKESQYAMLERLTLQREDHLLLKKYAEERGILFLSTPFSNTDVDFLDEVVNVPLFKCGSSDANNIPGLLHIASKGKPMILSTGMSSLEEVKNMVFSLKAVGKQDIVVLHCSSLYPTPMEHVHLRAINTIQKACGVLVGYSDHTLGIEVSIAAVAMGAVCIEKHFTLDKTMDGPDHAMSLEPSELIAMVKSIRNIEKALGSSKKVASEEELKVANVARKSIVVNKDIPAGTVLKAEYLTIKRPGTGICPNLIDTVIGKITNVDIKADTLLRLDDII
ncbi:MAG: N-acetylneuraminate synthase [Candidatus Magasanikbacteria bacterium CG10_big_fil_rev_8_21_14_0_10_38_6]|uniref:N-acetylneuraminate synthase n=1 Tax=Candidatus Magasanikbacteria bacterium CG10_big_fil_rev_8_21_14_0_10_38_6 TaxID=1974647 RepID=A0A2M6P0J3_9BACT|nr:MAG: N-acetylneuraminate synthase [Candidatus Magasanikbacteria bacterium CG10_big_fil_rev_8_21_14_0_10_38_6]